MSIVTELWVHPFKWNMYHPSSMFVAGETVWSERFSKIQFFNTLYINVPHFSDGPRRRRPVSKRPHLFSFFSFSRGPLSDWSRQTQLYSHWSTQTECSTHLYSKQQLMKLCGCSLYRRAVGFCTQFKWSPVKTVANPLNMWTSTISDESFLVTCCSFCIG